MWVDFRLPERFIARIRPGQTVDVNLDALPGQRFAGRVQAIDPLVDANGRSLRCARGSTTRSGVLRPGMFARTRIVFARRENALVVPEEALVPQGGKQYLIKVVDGAERQGVASASRRRVGMRQPGKVEILEGLAAGDTVVTAGQARLLRGDALPLQVVDIAKPARAPRPARRAPASRRQRPAA